LNLLANLSAADIDRPTGRNRGSPIWGGEPGDRLLPWSVFWHLGE
jgi:maltooligosyltrehalose trehalohydrolase